MELWSDDDALWEAMMPALAAPERYAMAERDAATIVETVGLNRGAAILDVGCGAGVHAVAFAAQGFVVTGVDRTAALLRVARREAEARSVAVTFVEADMREFCSPSTFDLACSLYCSFGYFDEPSNLRVLERIRASLRRGGVFVLDVLGREIVTRCLPERARHTIGGTEYVVRRSVHDSMLDEEWTVIAGGHRKEFCATQHVYSAGEIEEALLSAGFANVLLSGSFNGTAPYNEDARRLVAIARTE